MTLGALGIDPEQLIRTFGVVGLFAVVFAESGILLGFFLPGDSLLFTAGLLSATTSLLAPLPVLLLGCGAAAVIGDQVGYAVGVRVGPRLRSRPDSRLFKRSHLEHAEGFFARHGPKAIVLARFVPIVRTFTPVVAGTARMRHRTFTIYNVIGGLAWVVVLTTLGWALGSQFPGIGDYLDIVIVAIVLVSLLPLAIEFIRRAR
jgi:membrane-associated protein